MTTYSADDVRLLIANVFNIDASFVTNELHYMSIKEWDSLGHVKLMVSIEEHFGIRIEEEDAARLTNIEKIFYHLNLSAQGEAHQVSQQDVRNTDANIHRGLRGIYFDETSISSIQAENGIILYRDRSLADLLGYSYEQIVDFLLLDKKPSYNKAMSTTKKICVDCSGTQIKQILYKHCVSNADIMQNIAFLLNQIEAIGGPIPQTKGAYVNQSLRIIGLMPHIMAYLFFDNFSELALERSSLNFAEMLLRLLTRSQPSERQITAMNTCLIIHAEHGACASTFAARVAASAGGSLGACLSAAMSTFSGTSHGGATMAVSRILAELHQCKNISLFVEEKIASGEAIPGFGHGLYKVIDPRVQLLKTVAHSLRDEARDSSTLEVYEDLLSIIQKYNKYGLHPNVDGYTAVVYKMLGIPATLGTALFATSRMVGWLAHIYEQYEDNILIRPQLKYRY